MLASKLVTAQQSSLFDGELKIFGLNLPTNGTIYFEAIKISNTTHWDFQNNLVLNNDYTYQKISMNNAMPYCWFEFEDGKYEGMGKGLYKIRAIDSLGVELAYFYYDLRTCIIYGNSPDLEVQFNCANSTFRFNWPGSPWFNTGISEATVNSWTYTINMIGEKKVDLFEPQAPANLFVYSTGGHPMLHWNNNENNDYWTAVDVYRGEVYTGLPTSYSLIATLSPTSTSYYDTRYNTGTGAIAYYKVLKRNNQKNSAFSNTVSINIIPVKMIEENSKYISSIKIEDIKTNLYQNHPNPFNPNTEIKFELAKNGNISIEIFDIHGRLINKIVNGFYSNGIHRMNFNASGISSGIYFCILKADDNVYIRKMLLMK